MLAKDENENEIGFSKAEKDFKQTPNSKFWMLIVVGAFVLYVIILSLQLAEFMAKVQDDPIPEYVAILRWICIGIGVGEGLLSIYQYVRGILGEKDYQIFQSGFQLMLSNIQINDVDSTQVPIKFAKGEMHLVQLNETQRNYLFATNLFKERMNKEINSLQTIDLNPIHMFRKLDPKMVEIENLRFQVRLEYDKILELTQEDQLSLLWMGSNTPLYEKLKESNEFDAKFEKYFDKYMTEKAKSDKNPALPEKLPEKVEADKKSNGNGKNKNSKKEKEKEESTPAIKTEVVEKIEKAPEFNESVINSEMDPNKLLLIYKTFHNYRVRVWNELRETLKTKYRIELANLEDFNTYYIKLPTPKILLDKNWSDATDKENEEKGSLSLCITCMGAWDSNFKFLSRILHDKEANRFIKYDAALCSFQWIADLHARIPWLMKEGGNQIHKNNYKIAMHISQIRDLRDDILKYMSYNALTNNKQLRDFAIQKDQELEELQYKFDDMKGANMEKWIDRGEIPLKLINRSLAPPINVSHYWIFFFFSMIGMIILMIVLFKTGVFA